MQRDAIDAVRAGLPEVHVVTNLGHPMTAYWWSMDHLGAEWIACRNFNGSDAGWWLADTLTALERDYVAVCVDCGESDADPGTDNGETCSACDEARRERGREGDLFNYETARDDRR